MAPFASSFRRSVSRWSQLSIKTTLPEYSVSDSLDESTSPSEADDDTSSVFNSTSLESRPPRYSLLKPHLTILTPPDVADDSFRYSFPIKSKKPWAVLVLQTRDSVPGNLKPLQIQPRLPKMWGCDPVTGSVELELESPRDIQQITVTIHGYHRLVSFQSLQFLEHKHVLWSTSMSDRFQHDAIKAQNGKFRGRFEPGPHSFPFSFPFPTHHTPIAEQGTISPPTSPAQQSFPSPIESTTVDPDQLSSSLPQSFIENGVNADVVYYISVRIQFQGILKSDNSLRTRFTYVPASQPLSMSSRRRMAYETGNVLPSPMDDPDGWLALPTHAMYGLLNSSGQTHHTNAQCTLHLAQPLTYTRGSVIPCFLTISSDDHRAIYALSNPKIIVRLRRCIVHPKIGNESSLETLLVSFTNQSTTMSGIVVHPSSSKLESISVTHEVGRARWWLPKHVVQTSNIMHLEGEIHLDSSLQPSCGIHSFQIKYAVELLSVQTDQFIPTILPPSPGDHDQPLASKQVEITTLFRQDEPVPTVYSQKRRGHVVRQIDSIAEDPISTHVESFGFLN